MSGFSAADVQDRTGQTAIVTGASSGIGMATAKALVAHGAQVIGAARDLDKAHAATQQVRAGAGPKGGIELVELDLASLASVRACVSVNLTVPGRSSSSNKFRRIGQRPLNGPAGRFSTNARADSRKSSDRLSFAARTVRTASC